MKKLLFLCILSYGIYAHASFNLSGTTITQSDTDTGLTGLQFIDGVEFFTTLNGKIVYNLDAAGLRLDISGDLSFDPDFEEIHTRTNASRPIRVLSGGILRVGLQKNVNGKIRYSQGTAIVCGYVGGSGQFDPEGIVFLNGSQFFWNGGTIYSTNAMGAVTGQTNVLATINKGRFVAMGQSTNPFIASAMFFRNDGSASNVQVFDVELDHIDPSKGGAVVFSRNGATQMSFKMDAGFIQERSGSTSGALVLKNIEFENNAYQFDYEFNGTGNNSQGSQVTNADIGTNWRFSSNYTNSETGHISIFQELDIIVKDPVTNPIEDAKTLIKTTDSGNRINISPSVSLQNGVDFSQATNAFDEYLGISDASGIVPTQTILTGRFFSQNDGTSTIFEDLYSDSQIKGTDDFTLKSISYLHTIISIPITLSSSSVITQEVLLGNDTSITETDRSIVNGYATVDTAEQFYDAAKAFLYNNFTGETETIVTRSADRIDARAYDVVIDQNASQAFNFDGTTITIKSAEFIGEIVTTGTISFLNGSLIQGGYASSDGTFKFIFLDWGDSSTHNVSVINLDDNTELLTPTAATTTFRTHILMPTPEPASGVEVRITSITNGSILFNEAIENGDLTFIRLSIILSDIALFSEQEDMLQLLERVLVKVEATNNALNSTSTPNLTLNQTITNSTVNATRTNQIAILNLLRRVLGKVTASREAFEKN